MKCGVRFVLVIFCVSPPLSGQKKTKSPWPHTGGPSTLQKYRQSLDQIPERARRSVVQIDVTSYSVAEYRESDEP